MISRNSRLVQKALALVLLTTALFAAFPNKAFARDYTMGPISIDSTVEQDGTLNVRETRRFSFDGSFHGVYWKLAKGEYEGRRIEPAIVEVGEMRDGNFVPFTQADTEENGTYQIADYSSYDQVKLFSEHRDEAVDFVISFSYPDMVSRWDDVGELYWKFVSDGWDEPSNNVTCTVHLPVPEGASVTAGENVRAWGHGPLDASVSFDGNEVVYFVPGVGTSEFAEARITFPKDWVPGAHELSGSRLDAVLSEEQRWADEANAKRDRARIMVNATCGTMGVYALATLAVIVMRRLKYRQVHKPQFTDTYYRDVPSADHPAVLGALYKGGTPDKDDFTASLMRLADMGKIQLDLVKYQKKGAFGRMKEKKDYRMLQVERAEGGLRGDAIAASCDKIDRATMQFLFHTVAGHHSVNEKLLGPHREPYVLTSDFDEVARHHPESYENGYNSWKSAVTSSIEARGFNREEGGKVGSALPIGLGVGAFFVGMAGFCLGVYFDLIVPALVLMLLNIAVGTAAVAFGARMKGLSREAIELKAKLGALRRWLKDFTRLDEAIPTDVVLWNRMLVMATALGVADDVVRQLKVAMPQLLDDPYFYSYGWYYYADRGMGHPASVVGSSFGQAHSVSAAKLSASSDSSGGGGGGGFSGGGGGGFGGGGGGGAF